MRARTPAMKTQMKRQFKVMRWEDPAMEQTTARFQLRAHKTHSYGFNASHGTGIARYCNPNRYAHVHK